MGHGVIHSLKKRAGRRAFEIHQSSPLIAVVNSPDIDLPSTSSTKDYHFGAREVGRHDELA